MGTWVKIAHLDLDFEENDFLPYTIEHRDSHVNHSYEKNSFQMRPKVLFEIPLRWFRVAKGGVSRNFEKSGL